MTLKKHLFFPLFFLTSCTTLSNNDIAELFKAILLLAALLLFNRSALKAKSGFKHLGTWLIIFVILFAGYSYRDTILKSRFIAELIPNRAIATGTGEIIITRSNNGHFMVAAKVNGQTVNFLLDTGATNIALDPVDAKRIGLNPEELDYIKFYQTANGIIRAAPVRLSLVTIGDLQFYDVRASVKENSSGGSLLGMSFLDLFSSYEVKGDRIYLRK